MNERIKLLAEQAKDYADYYSMLSDSAEQEIFTEKFAELIVQECANIADKAEPYKANDLIKKHFGVEL